MSAYEEEDVYIIPLNYKENGKFRNYRKGIFYLGMS
jgi:hypothetical protein